jgi:hypothetical protein
MLVWDQRVRTNSAKIPFSTVFLLGYCYYIQVKCGYVIGKGFLSLKQNLKIMEYRLEVNGFLIVIPHLDNGFSKAEKN